ncbi:MAG: hypothetical protein ACXVEF_01505 [Polyangiales bacterium]
MHRDRFTVHHVILLVVLVGVAFLLGDDTLLPTSARIPGMLVLGAIGVWAGMKTMPHHTRLARATIPSAIPRRPSRPSSRPSRRS